MNPRLELAVNVLLPSVGALAGLTLMEQTGLSEYVQSVTNAGAYDRTILDALGAGAGAATGMLLSYIVTRGGNRK